MEYQICDEIIGNELIKNYKYCKTLNQSNLEAPAARHSSFLAQPNAGLTFNPGVVFLCRGPSPFARIGLIAYNSA